jgi:hypothetical protein
MTEEPPKLPAFLSGPDRNEIAARIREVADCAIKKKFGLLIGAGFSKDARDFPLGWELASGLLHQATGCGETEADRIAKNYELGAVAEVCSPDITEKRAQMVEEIKARLIPRGKQSQAEIDLATIISVCKLRRVFTTNFDTLIENCIPMRHRPVEPTVAGIRSFEGESHQLDCTGVFHLNGTLDDPKVTESDLRGNRSVFFEELRHELLTKVFVMVGYSFRDDAITKIFQEIFDLLQRTRQDRTTYLVMPVESDAEYRVATGIWKSRGGIRLLPLRAGVFLRHLVISMLEVRSSENVKQMAALFGEPEEGVKERLRPLEEEFEDLGIDDITEAAKRLVSVRVS